MNSDKANSGAWTPAVRLGVAVLSMALAMQTIGCRKDGSPHPSPAQGQGHAHSFTHKVTPASPVAANTIDFGAAVQDAHEGGYVMITFGEYGISGSYGDAVPSATPTSDVTQFRMENPDTTPDDGSGDQPETSDTVYTLDRQNRTVSIHDESGAKPDSFDPALVEPMTALRGALIDDFRQVKTLAPSDDVPYAARQALQALAEKLYRPGPGVTLRHVAVSPGNAPSM